MLKKLTISHNLCIKVENPRPESTFAVEMFLIKQCFRLRNETTLGFLKEGSVTH